MAPMVKVYKAKIEDLTKDGSYIAYISTWGDKDNLDADGDFFIKGAFRKSIKKRKGLFTGVHMHDLTRPVSLGRVEEDEKGTIVYAQINLGTKDGEDTYSNLEAKMIGDHSIGFDPNMEKTEVLKDKKGNITGYGFGEAKLFEYSALTNGFAANPNAGLIALKWRDGSIKAGQIPPDELLKQLEDGIDSSDLDNVDSVDKEAMAALMATIKEFKQTIQSYERR